MVKLRKVRASKVERHSYLGSLGKHVNDADTPSVLMSEVSQNASTGFPIADRSPEAVDIIELIHSSQSLLDIARSVAKTSRGAIEEAQMVELDITGVTRNVTVQSGYSAVNPQELISRTEEVLQAALNALRVAGAMVTICDEDKDIVLVGAHPRSL